jgi:predicted Zn finger-like uncharacterized protein
MVVQCSSCHTEFELDPVKVPASGVRARCSVCPAVITVPPPPAREDEAAASTLDSLPAPSAPSAPSLSEATPAPIPSAFDSVENRATPVRGVPVLAPADHTAVHKRPINPFLAKDPSLRAKRLARALVSDIVAYHPAKHAEGLREGTLKTLFRDEIKKSYDEYVDQVGQEFAESTTHFQDALNDVLAVGKKLF